jgi:hypothetical protein
MDLNKSSEFHVELNPQGQCLGLGVSNQFPQVEASGDHGGGGLGNLVLQENVQVSVVVDFHLGVGVIVESVEHTESGSNNLLLPVEGELGADGLGLGGVVVEEHEELAEGKVDLIGGLVSEANEGIGGGFPVHSEVVLVKVLGFGVNFKVVSSDKVVAWLVGELVLNDEGSDVSHEFELDLVVVELSADLHHDGGLDGLVEGQSAADELKSFDVGPLLQIIINTIDKTVLIECRFSFLS